MMTKDGLRIETVGGDMYLSSDDLLVWGVQNWALPAESCTENAAKDDRAYALSVSA